jgi:hypothetical protein
VLNGNEILQTINDQRQWLIKAYKYNGKDILKNSYLDRQRPDYVEDEINSKMVISAMVAFLEQAKVCYFEPAIAISAESGNKYFENEIFPAFNPPHQIWFSKLINPFITTFRGKKWTRNAEMLSINDDDIRYGVFLLQLEETGNGGLFLPIDVNGLPNVVQIIYKENNNYGPNNAARNRILAKLAFMNQPFIENTSLDRVATFQGAHHQAKKNDAKKIQIVYLRCREQHPTLQDGSPNPVDWSCQWLVQGHWRNQYHPSDQSHKPMFIQSYVKGPEDKPFKAPRERIFAAVR